MKYVIRIEIEVRPYKTVYHVGEYFDPTGMQVRAYYNDLSSSITILYTCSPSGPLSISNTSITINSGGVTTQLPIVVTDRYPVQNTNSANIGNNPFYNLFDQSIRFVSDDISVGRDSYTLSFNLIYHSRMPSSLSNLVLGLPDRFKTNYHQYVKEDGVDSNSNTIFKYIDGSGYIHTFSYAGNNLYYCATSDLYLSIDNANDYYSKITDNQNNKLLFSSDGNLIKMINGQDNTNVKTISFINNRISAIYDERKTSSYLEYNYDVQSRLSSISFIYQNQTIKSLSFIYNNDGFLTSVVENSSTNDSRTLYKFLYNSNLGSSSSLHNRIDLIESCLSHQVYRFSYSFVTDYSDYLISAYEVGVFNSQNTFLSKQSLTRVGYSFVNDYYLSTNEIRLMDQNNNIMSYFLDKDANITAVLSKSNNSEEYQTFYKESGVYINITGNQDVYINAHRFINCFAPTSITLSSDALSLLNVYKHFVLRFYLVLDTYNVKYVKAILNANGISSSPVRINVKQFEKYQLVEIPFSKTTDTFSGQVSFVISFKDEDNDNVSVKIGDVYLDKKARTTLYFLNGQYSFDDITDIGLFSQMNQTSPSSVISTSGDDYFSITDFLLSFKHDRNCFASLYSNHFDILTRPVYFNEGRKVNEYRYRFILLNGQNIAFDSINPGNTNLDSSNTWFFETISEDGQNKTRTYYRYATNQFEIINRVYLLTTINNTSEWVLLKEEKNSYHSLYDKRLYQTVKSNYEETAPLSSQADYEYFNNGELKKITATDGNETIVLYEATLNNADYIGSKTSGLNSVAISYSDYLESIVTRQNVSSGTQVSTLYAKNYSYDTYKEKLGGVSYLYNQASTVINELDIDYSMNKVLFNLNGNHLYSTTNDYENDSLLFSRYDNNTSTYQNVISAGQSNTQDYVLFFDTQNNVTVSNHYDSFKRVTNQKLNNITKVTFAYENNIENHGVSNLKSVTDMYLTSNGITTSFTYDSVDNSLLSINFDSGSFVTTFDYQNGKVTYAFTSSNISLQGLEVTQLSSNQLTYKVTYNHGSYELYRYFYIRKDNFDRPTSFYYKCHSDSGYLSALTYINDENRINSFSFGVSYDGLTFDSANYSETYAYDQFGNLNAVSLTRGNSTDSQSYAYDGFNRIIYESNSQVSTFNRSYSYYTNGKMEFFGSNHLTYNSQGQLDYFGSIHFTYDRYGNRLSRDNDQYTYERGKLLSTLTKNNVTTTFKYDYLGRRYQKISGGVTTTYYYDQNNKLISETINYVTSKVRLIYLYNGEEIIGFCRCDSNSEKFYYYVKNPFGLITAIYDENNALVGLYKYDSWGNNIPVNFSSIDSNNVADLNPIRYKGYYYDKETELYYLKSRYYDPSIGQFISPDDYSYLDSDTISGYNLYAYCDNNPVMFSDATGHMSDLTKWLIGGVTFIGAVALTYLTGGALAPVFIGMGVSILGGGLIQGIVGATRGSAFWDEFCHGAADGAMWGGVFSLIGATLRTLQMLRHGVAIGENMNRIRMFARAGGQITYNGMPGFKIISKVGGDEIAQKLALAHNAHFIKRMMRWGVTIVDYGIDAARIGGRSVFYAMEKGLVWGYEFLETMFFWGIFR